MAMKRTVKLDPQPPKKKRISTGSAKAKGRRLQQWVAEKISVLLNIPWGKDELIASREMGQCGTDIRLIGEAKKRFPFCVECKFQESWSVHAWIEQAKANQEEGMDWLVFAKRSRTKPIVIMDGKAFFELLKKLEETDDNNDD